MKKWILKNKKRVVILFFIYSALILFFIYPTPYEVLLPGGIDDADRIIEIENDYEMEGSFHSSYVSVITKPSPFQYLIGLVNKRADIHSLSEQTRQISVREINDSSQIEKKQSIYVSIILAYKRANKSITYDIDGAIVAYRYPDYHLFDDIRVGDIITHFNGTPIRSKDELIGHLVNTGCNDDIKLTVLRHEKTKIIETKQTIVGDTCKLGVLVYNHYTNLKGVPSFEIVDDSGYGSSAGLMQTLTIYNMLIEEDITRNLKIAGTGVIDELGIVRPIGGMKQKVYGAIKNDVDIFFAPNIDNGSGVNLYQEALYAKQVMKSDIIIVPVKTFDDCLDFLLNYQE